MALVFSKAILLTFFSILLVYGRLGLVTWVGFLGLGFSVDGVRGLWCGAFGVYWGEGSLYKHRRINLGKCFASWGMD